MQQQFNVSFENLSEMDKKSLIEELKAIEGVSVHEIHEIETSDPTLEAKGDTTVISQIVVSVVSALSSGLVLEYFKYWLKDRSNSKLKVNGDNIEP